MNGPGGRGWVIALAAALVILAYITYNTLSTPATSSSGLARGDHLPPFAAPLVTSDLVGDANVARYPHQGEAGSRPACSVTDPRALNSCILARRGPVVLGFLADESDRCIDALDAMREVSAHHPEVGFAAVAIRGDRADTRATAEEHGWRFPVAEDRDGAVANLYGVAICPTVVLAYRGGTVMRTRLGSDETTAAALQRAVERLERGRPTA